MRTWLTYPEYQESGVVWLAELPSQWSSLPLKRLLARNDGGVWGEEADEEGTIVLRSTEVALDGSWQVTEPALRQLSHQELKSARLQAGDLVVTKSSGSALHLGKTALVTEQVAAMGCCFSNFMQRLRAKPIADPGFLYWLLNSPIGREQLVYLGSTTTGLANLSAQVIGAVQVPVPAFPEQRAIAAFLDRETVRIDALIALKERQIELLQEKRAALISHAVTKGLDPKVPMKDSGVEWLGEIPAHWTLLRLKWTVTGCYGGIWGEEPDGEDDIVCIRVADFDRTRFLVSMAAPTVRSVPQSQRRNRLLKRGDLVLEKSGGGDLQPVGAVVQYDFDAPAVSSNFTARMPVALTWNSRFLAYVHAHLYAGRVNTRSIKQTTGIQNIDAAAYLGEPVAVPPLPEQRAIAAFLDRETARIDTLIAKVQTSIETLREYRSALISAAVTGKIDVRQEVSDGV